MFLVKTFLVMLATNTSSERCLQCTEKGEVIFIATFASPPPPPPPDARLFKILSGHTRDESGQGWMELGIRIRRRKSGQGWTELGIRIHRGKKLSFS